MLLSSRLLLQWTLLHRTGRNCRSIRRGCEKILHGPQFQCYAQIARKVSVINKHEGMYGNNNINSRIALDYVAF